MGTSGTYPAGDYPVESAEGLGAELEVRTAVGGYRGLEGSTFNRSVVAGDSNVSGDFYAFCAQVSDKGDGGDVVAADYGIWPWEPSVDNFLGHIFSGLHPEVAVVDRIFVHRQTVLFHGGEEAFQALLGDVNLFGTGETVDLSALMGFDEVVGYHLEGIAVVHGGCLEILMVTGVQQHNGLAGDSEEAVDIRAYLLAVEGVPVVEEAVEFFRKDEVEDIFFGILVGSAGVEVMQRGDNCHIAVAFEGL